MKSYNFWATPFLAIGLAILTATDDAGCSHSGIKGHVFLVRGNQMPSPDRQPADPPGLETELFIHALTNLNQVKREGSSAFYHELNTPLVAVVKTDSKGAFSVKLPAGQYSLFVKKDGKYYANLFDGNNNIYPVEVVTGQMTEVAFKADYDAVY